MRLVPLLLLALGTAAAQDSAGFDPLNSEIAALKAERPPWREIPWKSCLLDGLRESREKRKPLILWIFIDRPVDDARC
jgi:hypothetical protein